jgi:hypothetical protein
MKEELFESILQEAEVSGAGPGFTIGNTKVLPSYKYDGGKGYMWNHSAAADLTYKRPRTDGRTGYYAIIKYIVEHPFCKRREIIDAIWHGTKSRGQFSSEFTALHRDGFFRITNKWEYIPTGRAVEFVAEHEGKEIINPSEEEIEDHEVDSEEE